MSFFHCFDFPHPYLQDAIALDFVKYWVLLPVLTVKIDDCIEMFTYRWFLREFTGRCQ